MAINEFSSKIKTSEIASTNSRGLTAGSSHLHILGISGTFMCGLAILAKQAGFTVTGSDANCYPPISDLLNANDIPWTEGYEDTKTALAADLVIVGNAMKRGMPVIETILNARKPYISGPQWLAENILKNYRVIAVAGTHGKTTTTSMLVKILHAQTEIDNNRISPIEANNQNPSIKTDNISPIEANSQNPSIKTDNISPIEANSRLPAAQSAGSTSFLIGGVSSDFHTSANLGNGEWFVIEADEYDSAFFDKRPKFMHYRPEIAILNNLEFDHADIYSNLAAIEQQFHYLVRTIPGNGLIIKPKDDASLNRVINQACYSNIATLSLQDNATWRAEILDNVGQNFNVYFNDKYFININWPLIGKFNVENALAAIAAANQAGVSAEFIKKGLESFTPVKRRLEIKAKVKDITIYDDFAHHPTAISKTLSALQQSKRHQRILVVIEFASYTMRSGFHQNEIAGALSPANKVFALKPTDFSLEQAFKNLSCPHEICPTSDNIIEKLVTEVQANDAILIMSNRGFDNIHQRIIDKINISQI